MRWLSTFCSATMLAASLANACACDLPEIGSGRIVGVSDGRTLRLDDDRDIRLAGIELPSAAPDRQRAAAALTALAVGKDVVLRSDTDAPDRYGRQRAMVMLDPTTSIQAKLLAQGVVLASALAPSACARALRAAEADARAARAGIWATRSVIKNTESSGDILAAVGQFGIVDGIVRSVREVGGITYVNFGRRWTEDFALIVPKRATALFDGSEIALKSLQDRRVRVRGWISQRTGPRIEVFRVDQIEMLGDNASKPGVGRSSGSIRASE